MYYGMSVWFGSVMLYFFRLQGLKIGDSERKFGPKNQEKPLLFNGFKSKQENWFFKFLGINNRQIFAINFGCIFMKPGKRMFFDTSQRNIVTYSIMNTRKDYIAITLQNVCGDQAIFTLFFTTLGHSK